jgi:hypothetical protein
MHRGPLRKLRGQASIGSRASWVADEVVCVSRCAIVVSSDQGWRSRLG